MKPISITNIPDLKLNYPLFFQQAYAQYELTRGWEVKIYTDGVSYLPLKIKKAKYFTQGQYLYPPVKNGSRLSEEDEKIFMNEFVGYCKTHNLCDFIAPPMHFSVFHSVPTTSYFTEMGTIVVNLEKGDNDLIMDFNYSCRKKIRKVISEGLTVDFGLNYFDAFYSLYKEVHESSNAYYDTAENLKTIINTLGSGQCVIGVVKKKDDVLSALMVLYCGAEAYAYNVGSKKNHSYHGVNYLIEYEMMKWLKARGIKRYCMGGMRLGNIAGTKYEGIVNFKKNFEPDIEKGYHFYSKITWRYSAYAFLLKGYLKMKGIKQNTTGMNYRHN